jgi:hypothetical protein
MSEPVHGYERQLWAIKRDNSRIKALEMRFLRPVAQPTIRYERRSKDLGKTRNCAHRISEYENKLWGEL